MSNVRDFVAEYVEISHRFVDHMARLGEGEWDEVLQRAHAVDAVVHRTAVVALAAATARHPRGAALSALNGDACAAARGAAAGGRRRRDACDYAGRVAAQAALAVAVRDLLADETYAALVAPFATVAAEYTR